MKLQLLSHPQPFKHIVPFTSSPPVPPWPLTRLSSLCGAHNPILLLWGVTSKAKFVFSLHPIVREKLLPHLQVQNRGPESWFFFQGYLHLKIAGTDEIENDWVLGKEVVIATHPSSLCVENYINTQAQKPLPLERRENGLDLSHACSVWLASSRSSLWGRKESHHCTGDDSRVPSSHHFPKVLKFEIAKPGVGSNPLCDAGSWRLHSDTPLLIALGGQTFSGLFNQALQVVIWGISLVPGFPKHWVSRDNHGTAFLLEKPTDIGETICFLKGQNLCKKDFGINVI